MSGGTQRQRLASLMKVIHDGGMLRQHDGESQDDYFARLRKRAVGVQRHQRRLRNRNASAARKRNR